MTPPIPIHKPAVPLTATQCAYVCLTDGPYKVFGEGCGMVWAETRCRATECPRCGNAYVRRIMPIADSCGKR